MPAQSRHGSGRAANQPSKHPYIAHTLHTPAGTYYYISRHIHTQGSARDIRWSCTTDGSLAFCTRCVFCFSLPLHCVHGLLRIANQSIHYTVHRFKPATPTVAVLTQLPSCPPCITLHGCWMPKRAARWLDTYMLCSTYFSQPPQLANMHRQGCLHA